jgi:hypothetical protein
VHHSAPDVCACERRVAEVEKSAGNSNKRILDKVLGPSGIAGQQHGELPGARSVRSIQIRETRSSDGCRVSDFLDHHFFNAHRMS